MGPNTVLVSFGRRRIDVGYICALWFGNLDAALYASRSPVADFLPLDEIKLMRGVKVDRRTNNGSGRGAGIALHMGRDVRPSVRLRRTLLPETEESKEV